MSRRPGLTLTEVLVTLAILAFGILAILTLFPLAASQMAIAVREDRSAQAANAADGYIRAYWKTNFVETPGTLEPTIISAFDNPGGLTPAVAGEPSYPVVIDPMGFEARPTGTREWLGDGAGAKVARRTLSTLNGNKPYSFRACSLMDGMGFNENGHPTPDRELRYNWAWIVQCPDVVNKTVAYMSVIVYDNRPNLYAPTGSETVHTGTVTPRTTQVILSGSVNVKPGGWIMDATDPTVNTATNKIRHAIPYQVVSVVENGGNTTLELQTPLEPAGDGVIPNTSPYLARFVVMRGVTGVYRRTVLSPTPPMYY
jgi:prepilin-type N-terminal cleavage/methylation domain-containing protein